MPKTFINGSIMLTRFTRILETYLEFMALGLIPLNEETVFPSILLLSRVYTKCCQQMLASFCWQHCYQQMLAANVGEFPRLINMC